ncbi:biotin carboxyl carrier protein of acetyl-CoA carboxylase 1, chloroplastic-like [Musa acuminata AAA Group]|uniref:Biotin carboxyl carrier protein of acetyl-CoA carboxylase n=1 Tax=Musa acuminata subsp. malaccensis TaxID=214687 RepID=A0A804K1K5_MUSAM|nr:PREDICTED: biotin carboxyl carrier protein of acetyl-CoA carboxylase 1, chloroplastic [Musa acuminata subsp. malaccensis]
MASSSSLHAAPAAAPQVYAAAASASASSASSRRRPTAVSFPLPSKPKKPLLAPAKGLRLYRDRSAIAKAQLNEVAGGPANDAATSKTKAEALGPKGQDAEAGKPSLPSAPLSEEAISEFMTQVANIVKLVDSRDIVELQLKQNDCELIIRKKEALPQPPAPAPIVMQAPAAPAYIPSEVPPPPAARALPSPAAASSAPKASKSSHPPLKSPMAGTLYRSPGPGLPPFVKPGDKVNKGQILCIIEAMKLMNEIEADHAGTVVEILVEDGKPVGIDQPIFIIEP